MSISFFCEWLFFCSQFFLPRSDASPQWSVKESLADFFWKCNCMALTRLWRPPSQSSGSAPRMRLSTPPICTAVYPDHLICGQCTLPGHLVPLSLGCRTPQLPSFFNVRFLYFYYLVLPFFNLFFCCCFLGFFSFIFFVLPDWGVGQFKDHFHQ